MTSEDNLTLSEIARRLDVPQHRLIHLCEKGVVIPDIHDAEGRGSSRVFSPRNFLEFAVAMRLRDMMLPVAAVGAVVQVLRTFEEQLRRQVPAFSLAVSLRNESAPELKVIISDSRELFFSLGGPGKHPKLFGGVPLEAVNASNGWHGQVKPIRASRTLRGNARALGPEQSRFARLELSVTAVAQSLELSDRATEQD